MGTGGGLLVLFLRGMYAMFWTVLPVPTARLQFARQLEMVAYSLRLNYEEMAMYSCKTRALDRVQLQQIGFLYSMNVARYQAVIISRRELGPA